MRFKLGLVSQLKYIQVAPFRYSNITASESSNPLEVTRTNSYISFSILLVGNWLATNSTTQPESP